VSIVAVLDADVLVPVLSCDVLLSMFDADLYRPIVTPTILDEVERNLIASHPNHDPELLRRRVGYMTRALGVHVHADGRTTGLAEINAKDRHVVAAANAGKATHVVTNDRRLRREINRLGTPLQAMTSDQFATLMLTQSPTQVSAVIDTLVAKRIRPAVTRDEMIASISRAMPTFGGALAQ
jgi:rRNA-processing protein FCF1